MVTELVGVNNNERIEKLNIFINQKINEIEQFLYNVEIQEYNNLKE